MAQDGRSPRTTAPPCHRPRQEQQLPRSKAYRSYPSYRSAPPTTRSHLILFPKTCWIIAESREGRTISVRHQHRKRRANGGFLKFVPRLSTIPEEGGNHSCTPSAAGVVGRRRIKVGGGGRFPRFCKYLALSLVMSGVVKALFMVGFWGVVRFVVGLGVIWCRVGLTL